MKGFKCSENEWIFVEMGRMTEEGRAIVTLYQIHPTFRPPQKEITSRTRKLVVGLVQVEISRVIRSYRPYKHATEDCFPLRMTRITVVCLEISLIARLADGCTRRRRGVWSHLTREHSSR